MIAAKVLAGDNYHQAKTTPAWLGKGEAFRALTRVK